MRGLGVQTSSSARTLLALPTTRFIPASLVQDVFIHEAFRRFEVRFFLAVVVKDEPDLVVVFPVSQGDEESHSLFILSSLCWFFFFLSFNFSFPTHTHPHSPTPTHTHTHTHTHQKCFIFFNFKFCLYFIFKFFLRSLSAEREKTGQKKKFGMRKEEGREGKGKEKRREIPRMNCILFF